MRTIAILPFVNLSSDTEQEYLSDGITEELINALVRVPGLEVTSRTSAFRFKGQEGACTIGQRLRAGHVLEGSVRRVGNRVRITVRLVAVSNDAQLWSELFDRDMGDLFATQEDIVGMILERLPGRPLQQTASPVYEHGTENLEAYNFFLIGLFQAHRRTPPSMFAAAEAFQHATELDPGYAQAHARLAECWALLGFDEFAAGVAPLEAIPRARKAALRALQLQSDLAEAHTVLGIIAHTFEWDWAAAEREYVLATKLAENAAVPLLWYAQLLSILGRDDESLRASHQARAIEPLSAAAQTGVGRSHYSARRFSEAERALRAELELEPGYVPAHTVLARVCMVTGRYAEGLVLLERAAQTIGGRPPLVVAMTGAINARMGRDGEAQEALHELERVRLTSHVPRLYDALVAMGRGRIDDALDALERSCDERSGWLPFVCRDPWWDELHEHPRFAALVRRVGLVL
jgi:serine/threonine-protein kinase